jgi:hypothetical protein
MADTYTTNLNLTKPEPGAAEDTWGISLNADLDSLDAIFGSGGTAVSMGAVTLDGLTVNSDTILLDSGSSAFMKIDRGSNSTFGIARYYTAGVENWRLGTINDSTSNFYLQDASSIKRFQVATNGDISFYEDTGSTQALFWDSSAERLGIGTTSPAAPLHITQESNAISGTNVDVSNLGLKIINPQNDNNEAVGMGFSLSTASSNIGAAIIHQRDDVQSRGSLSFATKPALAEGADIPIRMTISSDGDVGIGTTSPSKKLHVSTGDTNVAALFENTSSNGTVAEFLTSGDGRKLTVQPDHIFSNGILYFGSGSYTNIYRAATHTFQEDAGNTEIMRITGGNVGIGTSSPSEKLTVAGIVKSNGFSTNTAGVSNFIAGVNAGNSIISGGEYNTLIGDEAGTSITTGDFNVAVGTFSLDANTTAGENTAIGYASLSNNITGTRNVASGFRALQLNTAANDNTATGYFSLYSTTGSNNTAIGKDAGKNITTGSKNTIIGSFDGNEGGLDIRTANNHIVLSDGDGNPRQVIDSSGRVGIGTSSPTETLHVMSGVSNDTVAIISGSQSDRGLTISTYASDGRTDGGVDLDAYKSFKFTTDGTERARIDSSGNIGIKNSNPTGTLTVGTLSSGQTGNVVINNEGGNTATLEVLSRTNRSIIKIADNDTNGYISAEGGLLSIGRNSGSNAANINIDSSNNVGIGDSSPDAKLTVQGDVLARDEFRGEVVNYAANQDAPYLIAGTSGYTGATTNWNTFGFQHRIKTDSGGSPRVTIDTHIGEAFTVTNNNRVGIGTGAPSTALHVSAGDGSAELTVARTGTYASSWSLKPYNADFYIRESGSDRVTFKAGGTVGIGATSHRLLL